MNKEETNNLNIIKFAIFNIEKFISKISFPFSFVNANTIQIYTCVFSLDDYRFYRKKKIFKKI